MSNHILATTLCLLVTAAGAQMNTTAAAYNPGNAKASNLVLPEVQLRGNVPLMVAIVADKLVQALPQPFAVTIVSSNDALLAGPGVQKVGSPTFLLVTLTNNSTRTVSVPSFDGDYYTIDVRDEHGKSLPESDEARKIKGAKAANARIFRSGLTGELKPREALRRTIDLSQYVNIRRSGKYTIQLTRKLPEELGPGVVKSNTISVTVTQ